MSANAAQTADLRGLKQALRAEADLWSQQRLARIGLPPDARCLEVGAGPGTMARWLADQVPGGLVTATDIVDQGNAPHPRLTFKVHDIVNDPLDDQYDLIYVRAVVSYLPDPAKVLQRLAEALAPGGTLVVEELTCFGVRCSTPRTCPPQNGSSTGTTRCSS